MQRSTLNIGIIGCGRMGKIRAEATLHAKHNLLAAFDPSREKLEEFKTIFPSCQLVDEIDEIPWGQLDAVFICSPPCWHNSHLARALSHNKPFFIEKPLSINSTGIAGLARECEDKGIINAVGYMNRYRPSIQYVKTLSIIGISGYWINKMYQVPWWAEPSESGGPLNEQATHLLDLNRYILGEVEEVFATSSPGSYNFPTTVSINLKFESGELGNILYSCDAHSKSIGLNVFTKEEQINLTGWDFNLSKPQLPAFPDLSAQQIFNIETEAFFNGVIEKNKNIILSDIRDAIKTQILVDAVNYSLKMNSVVSINNFKTSTLEFT